MKTQTCRLATLVAALSVMVFALDAQGQGIIRFDLYDGIVQLPSSGTALSSILAAIQAGSPQNGNWNYVAAGSTVPLQNIFFNGTSGAEKRTGFVLETDSLSLSLSQVIWTSTDPIFGASSGTFASYSNFGFGVNKGPDGVLGTGDDIVYTDGHAESPVHLIVAKGLGFKVQIGNKSTSEAVDSWKDLLYHETSLSVLSQTVTSRVNFGVPEPTSSTVFATGLVCLYLKRRKR